MNSDRSVRGTRSSPLLHDLSLILVTNDLKAAFCDLTMVTWPQ